MLAVTCRQGLKVISEGSMAHLQVMPVLSFRRKQQVFGEVAELRGQLETLLKQPDEWDRLERWARLLSLQISAKEIQVQVP